MDELTTCVRAVPSEDGNMAVLVVTTRGEEHDARLLLDLSYGDDASIELIREPRRLVDVTASARGLYVVAAEDGHVYEVDREAKPRQIARIASPLAGVHASAGAVYVHGGKRIWKCHDDALEELPPLPYRVLALGSHPTAGLHACGKGGLFARLRKDRWEVIDLGMRASLQAIVVRAESVFLAGTGVLGEWTPATGTWSPVAVPRIPLHALADYGDQIWIGAGNRGLGRIDSGVFKIVKRKVTAHTLTACDSYLGIAGADTSIRFDRRLYDLFEDLARQRALPPLPGG